MKMKFAERLQLALRGDAGLRDLISYVNKLASEKELMECLSHYLIAFTPESKPLEEPMRLRGTVAGRNLFRRGIELAGPLNALLDLVPPAKAYAIYEPAWKRLLDDDRGALLDRARKKRSEIRDRTTALTPLYKAFIDKHPEKAPTPAALYAFDPAPNEVLRKEFETLAMACSEAWSRFSPFRKVSVAPTPTTLAEFDAEFKRFQEFLTRNEKNPLVLFQILKWTRAGAARSKPPVWSIVWPELYLDTAFHIFRTARLREVPEQDALFFRSAVRLRVDQESLMSRIGFGLRNVPGFLETTRARRRHNRFADHSLITLVDEFEQVELLNRIDRERKAHPDAVAKRFIKVESIHDAFRDKHRVGQEIMEYFTIIWIEGGRVYLEFHHLECVLFSTDSDGLERMVKKAFFKALARNAAALTVFLLAYLEVLGLVLDVVTAGTAGGFRRILWEFAKERLKDKAVDKALDVAGVDNQAARFAAGTGVNFVRIPKGSKLKTEGFDVDAPKANALDAPKANALDAPKANALDAPKAGSPADRPKASVIGDEQARREARRQAGIDDINEYRQRRLEQRQEQPAFQEELMAANGSRGGAGYRPPRPVSLSRDVPAGGRGGRRSGGGGGGQGGGGGGGGGGGLRRRPAESAPENHPITERPPENYDVNYLRTFYTSRVNLYPPHIQDMIQRLPRQGSGRAPSHNAFRVIDKAIRDEHTLIANRMAGYANKADKPFTRSARGLSNEGNRFSSMVTDGKGLTLIGRLKSGRQREVEFDSVGFVSHRLVETKMNLGGKTDAAVVDQMRKQAEFARDWGFPSVRWEVYDYESMLRARGAAFVIRRDDPSLGAFIEDVVDPTQAF